MIPVYVRYRNGETAIVGHVSEHEAFNDFSAIWRLLESARLSEVSIVLLNVKNRTITVSEG